MWDARDVAEWRLVHRGNNDRRFHWNFVSEARNYAKSSAAGLEDKVRAAQRFSLGKTGEEVIETLTKEKILPKKALEEAYRLAMYESDTTSVDPRSAWGFAQGITRLSQQKEGAYADRRHEIDRAAGRVLHLAL